MMLYWRFAWRELRQRPSRPILTLLSIVIGVAAVVAVSIASNTTKQAFDEIFKTVAGKANLEVSAGVGTSFDQKVVENIRQVPGVKAVAPLVQRSMMLYLGQKDYRVAILGIDPQFDQQVRDYELTEGQSLAEKPGILLSEGFAKSTGVKVGQEVELQTQVGFQRTTVVGLYKSQGTATTAEGSSLLMLLPAAQHFCRMGARIDSAQIVTEENADIDKVKASIKAVVPQGLSVEPPVARNAIAEETSLSTSQGMRMARGFSLLVAVFIITNTFLINVTQRRRQIGIMRAIGATRSQIAGMMYREAVMMGILGTVLGSLLGLVAAHYLSSAMGSLYRVELPPMQLSLYPFLIATGCGLGISLVAAALPARKATHLSPLEAMRDVLPDEIEGSSSLLVYAGVVVIAVCTLCLSLSIAGWLPMVHAIWSSILMLAGIVLILPMVVRPLSAVVVSFFKPLAPVESRLARQQLLRHGSRTALTIGVVFIAASTGIGLANSVMDNVENVRSWYRKAIVADFFVRATAPDMATGLGADLPETVGAQLKRVEGIKSMDAMRYQRIKVAEEQAILIARDHTTGEEPDLDVMKGDIKKLREDFIAGQVAIGSVLAQRTKLHVGDEITLEPESGPLQFKVAAIVNDYHAGGLTIHMERAVGREKLNLEGVDAYVIKADHGRLDSVRQELETIAKEHGLMLQTFSDIQQSIDRMMSGVVASLWAMVVLGLVVSAVGVTNTLTINVLEQTRELGLLRIVAMTQAQVRKTIFTQAIIMALLALVPGIIAGVAVAYLINMAMLPVIGHAVEFRLHPWLLSGGLVAGIFVVACAAWFPANRAAKLDLLDALRTL